MAISDRKNADRVLSTTIEISPTRPEPYLNLALFYATIGEREKVNDLVHKGVEYGGREMVRSMPILAKYLERGN
jgi:hypothetical protein